MDDNDHVLRPICNAWLEVIKRSRKHKEQFQSYADECMEFFSGDADFMWKQDYKFRFFSGEEQVDPKFHMTMNKAFELVALFGPMLYHRNPARRVSPRQSLEFSQDIFGPPTDPMALQMGDPMAMAMEQQKFMLYQQAMMAEQKQKADDAIRAQLLEKYLNYTPNEMPGGGLKIQAEKAITEALLKGRGCLWTRPWNPPGSESLLVISEFDSVDNLYVDPDADCIDNAMWIARKCVHPYWEVERDYGLEPGSLKDYCTVESADSQERSQHLDDMSDLKRDHGQTNDLIVYYKIWSKMGVGARLVGDEAFRENENVKVVDEMLGDYIFLAVAPQCPYPLNLPTEMLAASTPEEVQAAAEWPVPFHADSKWPVACLDFYFDPGDAWPLAPLRPGLPELRYLNTMASYLMNRVVTSSRDFIAIAKSAGEDLVEEIKNGKDQVILRFSSLDMPIDQQIKFIQQPETRADVWQILNSVAEMFDKRVGLTELLYGMASTQSRTATDAAERNEKISIRPDYMAAKVEEWLTEVSRKEAICARMFLEGPDVEPPLGPVGAYLWQTFVLASDVERCVRELEYKVEENSVRKPNYNTLAENINQAMQMFLPLFQGTYQMTGNPQQLNALIAEWGKATQTDVSAFLLPPMMPPQMPAEGEGDGSESSEPTPETAG